MDNTDDLRLLLASRYPLIIADMRDEQRFMEILCAAAERVNAPVWIWSIARGLARLGQGAQLGTADPNQALSFIESISTPGVFVFADAHQILDNPVVVRRFKEIAQRARPGQTVVLTAPRRTIPPELAGLALPWTLRPPTRDEIRALVKRTLNDLHARKFRIALDEAGVAALVDALRGLSTMEAERLIQQAAVRDGTIDSDDIAFVRGAKAELLQSSGALELVEADLGTLDDTVGGLERLKDWLRLRGRAFEPEAERFGLEAPRGVLVTGVPGCGKSLVAKTLARSWGLPLVLLDASRLYGPYVGESEQRLHDALHTVESMAPVVLWIDEIEKGFESGRGSADGGVSRRLLGTFLRWMQDRPKGVFVIATSNDVGALPPELLRKGRFDEIFFVDLPGAAERTAILSLHLARRGRDPAAFDLDALVSATEGFSGAEIEAAVVGSLYRAYSGDKTLSTDELLEEVRATVPLAHTRAEDLARLRAWAAGRAVPASGPSTTATAAAPA